MTTKPPSNKNDLSEMSNEKLNQLIERTMKIIHVWLHVDPTIITPELRKTRQESLIRATTIGEQLCLEQLDRMIAFVESKAKRKQS